MGLGCVSGEEVTGVSVYVCVRERMRENVCFGAEKF